MSDSASAPDETREERFRRLTELIAAIVLSVAALLSSYAGFQGELWDGEQAANYALAEQNRTDSSKKATVAVQFATLDAMLFAKWIDAYSANNKQLETFYRERFRPEFRPAFEQWRLTRPETNPKAPPTPFHMPGYLDRTTNAARNLERKADERFADGQRANDISDAYGQGSVILALALFMGGITQTFDTRKTRVMLLGLATFCLLLGVVRILGLPAIRLW